MKNARNQDAGSVLPVEHDMPTLLHAVQAGANVLTRPTELRPVRKFLATRFKIIDVADRLGFAPCTQSVPSDVDQVGFGAQGKTECRHELGCFWEA